jgi:hypothetical protein
MENGDATEKFYRKDEIKSEESLLQAPEIEPS